MTPRLVHARRFLRLCPADRRQLLWTLAVVVATRVALTAGGTRAARSTASAVAAWCAADGPVERLAWSVAAAGRYVPGATCLTQSLALQALLGASGRASRVEIGVATDAGFRAHAWVVSGGRVLLGGRDLQRYARIHTLE
jgi:hypothetical protein